MKGTTALNAPLDTPTGNGNCQKLGEVGRE